MKIFNVYYEQNDRVVVTHVDIVIISYKRS